ncbi:hypothetical protein [Spiroplasma endosymbiont of Virgichneumon dumeticola]|uniref:hypothetical protein n=1 Tax=Spiroplasma endosymbiont of Virgichneumon dumeticola TaxID=3139323 RepID=UPI0035C87EFF
MGLGKRVVFKAKFSDFLLWTGLIVIIVALIVQFTTILVGYAKMPPTVTNPHKLWIPPDGAWVGLWTLLSTFTIQSNLLLLFFFCFVLTNRFYENRCLFIHGRFGLAITTYITITGVVFFSVLFKPWLKSLDTSDPISITNFVNTFLLHLVTPLIMVLYYLLTAGKYYWEYKKQAYLWTPIISIYMFAYLGYALAKGNFVGMVPKGKTEIDYSFSYSFLNFHDGLPTFFIYIGVILALYLVLIVLFTFYNNLLYKKKNKSMVILRDNDV